jgi:hypothetical protein
LRAPKTSGLRRSLCPQWVTNCLPRLLIAVFAVNPAIQNLGSLAWRRAAKSVQPPHGASTDAAANYWGQHRARWTRSECKVQLDWPEYGATSGHVMGQRATRLRARDVPHSGSQSWKPHWDTLPTGCSS